MLVAIFLRECAREIILACNLLCQAEAQSRVPVRLPVLQGTWKASFVDHAECDLATVIAIRPLTQPRTCEMGSSIFSAMSRLKVASMTRASFLIMPSNEKTNGEKISIACGIAYSDYLSFASSPNEPGAYPLAHTCRYPRQVFFDNFCVWDPHFLGPVTSV